MLPGVSGGRRVLNGPDGSRPRSRFVIYPLP